MKVSAKILLGLLFFLCGNCTLRVPQVILTGETAELEKQILGAYYQLKIESYSIASSMAAVPGQAFLPNDRENCVLQAMKDRESRKADLNKFKRLGIIGEQNRGLLQILHPEKMAADSSLQHLVTRIVREENMDRGIILNRLIQMFRPLDENRRDALEEVFAEINRRDSEPGTYVQLEDGRWVRK